MKDMSQVLPATKRLARLIDKTIHNAALGFGASLPDRATAKILLTSPPREHHPKKTA